MRALLLLLALIAAPHARADALPPMCDRAIDLIVAFEVGSPQVYERKYRRPIWPGAQSGVTIGIGYDLGYNSASIIAQDWAASPHAMRLATAAGITGPLARAEAARLADVVIEYGLARQVFDQTVVIRYHRLARRVFNPRHFDALPCNARGALISLVFNRGGSLAGERRREMRHIRDVCLPAQDVHCIATQIRAMTRIWIGTDIERGMHKRRYAEADLAESP